MNQVIYLGILFVVLIYILRRHALQTVENDRKAYETEFLREHREFIEQNQTTTSSFIPLRFQYWHRENLLGLCKQYRRRFLPTYYLNACAVDEFQPKVQVHFLGFRRVDEKRRPDLPQRIELIRCTKMYALITTDWGSSSFLLTKDPNNDSIHGVTFYIADKFKHEEIISYPGDTPVARPSQLTIPISQTVSRLDQPPNNRSAKHVTFAPTIDVQYI